MRFLASVAVTSFAIVACTGGAASGEGEGEGEVPLCFVGDRDAPAEITLVGIAQLPAVERDLVAGVELPLVVPPEDGHVLLISVHARNVSCELTISVVARDPCLLPPNDVVSRKEHSVRLAAGEDGLGTPEFGSFENFAKLPMCPSFGPPGDVDDQRFVLAATITEALRTGEGAAREHELDPVTIVPVCADAACACECDGDFELSIPLDEQCPAIQRNDAAFGECVSP